MQVKTTFILLVFFIFLIPINTCYSQLPASDYEVAKWPDFRKAAVSYTFDDGCPNQFAVAIPMFNDYGFKLTLFTITDSVKDWTNLINAGLMGHEIANHTASHIDLSKLTVEQQKTQIVTANDLINNHITGQKCVTMAYPFCVGGKDSLYKKYFIAARSCQGSIEPSTPANFMHVSSLVCGTQGGVKTGKNFKTYSDNAATKSGWIVYLIHGIDSDGGWSPIPSAELRTSLDYLADNRDKFWVTTFGDASRYIRERNCVAVLETSVSDTSISLLVNDTLDNEIFNLPVSIRRPLLQGWKLAKATQNGLPVQDTVVEISTIQYIVFDAVPDGGEVVLKKINTTGISGKKLKTNSGRNGFDLRLNNNILGFTLPESCGNEVTISLYDLSGKCINIYKNPRLTERSGKIDLSGSTKSLFYIVRLTDGKSVWNNKIVIL